MKIIEQSKELSKVDVYMMTKDAGITSMKDTEPDTVIDVDAWLLWEQGNGDETVQLLSIRGKDGKTYVTNSGTFIDSFCDIADIFSTEPFSIRKINGKTKSGRDFINCALHVDFTK